MVSKCPQSPLKMQHTPHQIPRWKDLQPLFCTESSSEAEIWDPVSTKANISTPSATTLVSLACPSNHTKISGL